MESKSTRFNRNSKIKSSRGIPKCPSEKIRMCKSDDLENIEIEINLGKNLRNYLKERNISQTEFSKAVGLQQSTIHNYLYDSIPKGLVNIIKLARKLELELDELIFGINFK